MASLGHKELRWGIAGLTHWGRITHICVDNLTIIGSENGLSTRQTIIWTTAGILLICHLGTYCSEIFNRYSNISFRQMRWKVSYAKWRSFCLGRSVLSSDDTHSTWIPSSSQICPQMIHTAPEYPAPVRFALRWYTQHLNTQLQSDLPSDDTHSTWIPSSSQICPQMIRTAPEYPAPVRFALAVFMSVFVEFSQ